MRSLPRARRRRDLLVLGATGAVALAGLTAAPAGTALAAPGCSVTYTTSTWQGGFSANITIKNVGDAVNGWTLGFSFPNAGQKVGSGWSATWSQSGAAVTARNLSYNGSIPTGGSVDIGFNGTHTGSNPSPTAFTLNGVTCTGATTTPTTSPSPTPTPSPSSSPTPTASPSPTATATTAPPSTTGTPLSINGQLRVCGVNLCNQYNRPIQLRGASSHGLQWFDRCYNSASLDALATDWKSDLFRIAMYVQEGGYETDPTRFTNRVNQLVDMATARGMYSIIDFHTLTPGDPNYNLQRAKTFFSSVSARNKDNKGVIYEIANEPNGVDWATIKRYADQVIPVIRANDPDAVIIVGTMGYSSLGVSGGGTYQDIVNNKIADPNVMYAFHFYAASHKDNYRQTVSSASAVLPLFVSEFGTVTYTGGGAVDVTSSNAWFDLMNSRKISYANWTYSDANEGSAAFKSGTCAGTSYSSYAGTTPLTESGALVRSKIMTADSFPTS